MGSWRALLLAGLALALSACGIKQAYEDANGAVAAFHAGLDRESYDALWEGSADGMKRAAAKADFAKFLGAVHTKLGKVKSSQQTGINVNSVNGSTTITVQAQTEFEKGKASETFTFVKGGEKLLLLNYNINSPAFVIG